MACRTVRPGALAGLLLGLCLPGAACGVDTDPGPAPSGQQRLAGRDLTTLFYWNDTTLAFFRPTDQPDPVDGMAGARNLWVWPDGMAAPVVALTRSSHWQTWKIGDLLLTGDNGELAFDLATLSTTNLNVAGPNADGQVHDTQYAALRPDGGALLAYRGDSLLVGRPAALTEVPVSSLAAVDFLGEDLAVIASFDPGKFELSRVAVPSGQVTPLGAPPFDPGAFYFNCAAFQDNACANFRTVACDGHAAACPDGTSPSCSIFYLRADPSGATGLQRPFMFDVASATETALPGQDVRLLSVSPDQRRVAWVQPVDPAAGTDSSDGPTPSVLHFRDLCTGLTARCPLATWPGLSWRPDGGVLVAGQSPGAGLPIVTFPDGACTDLSPNLRAGETRFSEDGTRMAWLGETADGTFAVWAGDGTGRSPVVVASGGPIGTFSFSPDGTKIIVGRTATTYFSLSSIDLNAAPLVEHPITELVSIFQISTDRRLMAVDRWNQQDESGRLVAADFTDGTIRVLAESVTDFAAVNAADGSTRAAYLVRGRFPSARDGIWETTLPPP